MEVPIGNHTEWQEVSYTEGDPLRYVITSFGVIPTASFGFKPVAYANLTVKGLTGINNRLSKRVRPINTNWTQYVENFTRAPPGFPQVYRYEITQDTPDIFEFKRIVNEEFKVPNPDHHGDEGKLYRYDKHRGILLHQENQEWGQSGGYIAELDFLGPYSDTQTTNSGLSPIALFLWLVGILFLVGNRHKRIHND